MQHLTGRRWRPGGVLADAGAQLRRVDQREGVVGQPGLVVTPTEFAVERDVGEVQGDVRLERGAQQASQACWDRKELAARPPRVQQVVFFRGAAL
jgi:hypothetical protein